MLDAETARLERLTEINADPMTRDALEAEFGTVWDTRQLAAVFVVTGIIHPPARRPPEGR